MSHLTGIVFALFLLNSSGAHTVETHCHSLPVEDLIATHIPSRQVKLITTERDFWPPVSGQNSCRVNATLGCTHPIPWTQCERDFVFTDSGCDFPCSWDVSRVDLEIVKSIIFGTRWHPTWLENHPIIYCEFMSVAWRSDPRRSPEQPKERSRVDSFLGTACMLDARYNTDKGGMECSAAKFVIPL